MSKKSYHSVIVHSREAGALLWGGHKLATSSVRIVTDNGLYTRRLPIISSLSLTLSTFHHISVTANLSRYKLKTTPGKYSSYIYGFTRHMLKQVLAARPKLTLQ
jgi:hypothetical protein